MGYSCAAKADYVLNTFRGDGESSNTWRGPDGREYFYEVGRENRDGAITGSVWCMDGYRKGSFRIARDGRIERAPCGLKDRLSEVVGIANYLKAHEPREAWAYACAFDGIEPGASFVVFSPENPYA